MDGPDYLRADNVIVPASTHRLKRARRGFIGGCIESTTAHSSRSSSSSRPTNVSGESPQSDDDRSSRTSTEPEDDSRHCISQQDSTHASSSVGPPAKRLRQRQPPQSSPSHPTSNRHRQSSKTPCPRQSTPPQPTVATCQQSCDHDNPNSIDETRTSLSLQGPLSSLGSATTSSTSGTTVISLDPLSAPGESLEPDASSPSSDTSDLLQESLPLQTPRVSSKSHLYEYYSLPLGKLPPTLACRKAQKWHLGDVPIRDYCYKKGQNTSHRHFFSKATPDELAADKELEGKILCRVKVNGLECNFSLKSLKDSRMFQRFRHITSEHGLMLCELNEFRMNQLVYQLDQAKGSTATHPDQRHHNCLVPAEKQAPHVDRELQPRLTFVPATLKDDPTTIVAMQDNGADPRDVQDHRLPAIEVQESFVECQLLPRVTSIRANLKTTSNEQLTRIVANAIAVDSLPMSILNTTLVKNLVQLSNPNAMIPTRADVERALSLSYVKSSAAAKSAVLEADISLGSFTADIWKSHHQGKRFLGLTFHYLSRDFEPRSVPLGIKFLDGSLNPGAIKNFIDDSLHEWSLMDKVFCGTADERLILERAMGQVCRQQDNGIARIACTCYKIQLCINDALEECKEAAIVLERSNSLLKLLEREGYPEDQPGRDQQNQEDHLRKKTVCSSPTTYCKPSVEGDDGRLYWCSLYLLVRAQGVKLCNERKRWTWTGKLEQAALSDEEANTLLAILPVLQPLFDSWVSISGGGNGDINDSNSHESCDDGSSIGGRKDLICEISKVYPAIHKLIEADAPVTHPIANALQQALVGQLKRYWSLNDIPDPVLMATYLDPAAVSSPIFKSTIERNNTRVDLRSYAASIIAKSVHDPLGTILHNAKAGVPDTESNTPEELLAELHGFHLAVIQDPPNTFWDDPRSWWQRHMSAMPLLSSVARICFTIQATSLPPAQLFGAAQGSESILTDPRGHANEYMFIRLLTVRNLYRFLHGHSASQWDVADLAQ